MSGTDRIVAAILAGAKASAEGKTKIEEYANEYSQFLRFLQGQQEAKAGEQIKAVAATWREWGKEGLIPTGAKGEKRPADVKGDFAWIITALELAGVEFIAENGGGAAVTSMLSPRKRIEVGNRAFRRRALKEAMKVLDRHCLA